MQFEGAGGLFGVGVKTHVNTAYGTVIRGISIFLGNRDQFICASGWVCLKFCLAGPGRDVGSW